MSDQNLKEVTISFDLFCEWEDVPPIYRIYVDDDLLVERSYIWRNPNEYINENLVVLLPPGTHKFNIIPAERDVYTNFNDTNVKINGIMSADFTAEFTI